jgi:hypothetical protein
MAIPPTLHQSPAEPAVILLVMDTSFF